MRVSPTIRHSSPATSKFGCDGKKCFEVLIRRKRFTTEERYWCDERRGYFDPASVHCEKWERNER